MNLERPLQVVAPTLDGDVLTLLASADRAWSGRAIERAIRASHGGVRRALEHLVEEGIVLRERAGSAYMYRLNREHLAARWIEGLASLRLQLIERLRTTVEAWPLQPAAAVLFGSAARREAGRASDIDILVVRPRDVAADDPSWRDQLTALEVATTHWTGNDARILEFDEDEADPKFERVIADAVREGVPLVGSLPRERSTRRRR